MVPFALSERASTHTPLAHGGSRMTTERTPLSEPSLLAFPMAMVTRFALRYPVAVIAVAIGLSVVAGLLTVGKLEFHTSRLDLLDPKCSHNQLWKDYVDEFGSQDDAIVVVQGNSREQIVPVLQELSAELARRDNLFSAVLHEVDCSKIRGKGLYYLEPGQLEQIEQMLARFAPVLAGDWSQLNLSNKIDELCENLHDPALVGLRPATLAEFDRLSLALSATLVQPDQYRSPWPDMPELFQTLGEPNSTFFLINEGRWGLILLRLATEKEQGSFAPGSEAIDTLRRLTAQAESRHPGVRIGLTGLPILENDEMRSSEETMIRASILSLVGVACLFVAGFGGVRHPMMAVVTLLLAMAWSFGYITLAIGHLNILSIAFAVVLIGLGIDFGVHYVARYLQERQTSHRSADALVQTAVGVGPGVITGAVTTAIAFFMAGFTEFKGVAELGIIAGGGILLCCAAAMVVLPAMIHLSD
ncbi:MAG TPA: hypothetical protein DD670_05495, partial [Planctomycetaceae bacterium]|nr:hypothetical protein [Planctomycetaceae bacterium]